jgi:peptidoglycan lytic transglycosylase G
MSTAPPQEGRRRRRSRLWLVLLAGLAVLAAIGIVTARRGGSQTPTTTAPTEIRLTVPEGMRREDVATLFQEKTGLPAAAYLAATAPGVRGERLAGAKRPTSLEGFLFPDTYFVDKTTTAADIVNRQLEAYRQNVAGVDMRAAARKNLTPFDVLTIASMVEREVQVPSERPVVAGIIYNRLHRRMRLDIDATVQYAVGAWRDLTAKDLRVDSPYNTRRFPGLPPGPIASPGLASIEAAAHPKASDYLYYVARNDGSGRHYFATNEAEFLRLQEKAQANGGG